MRTLALILVAFILLTLLGSSVNGIEARTTFSHVNIQYKNPQELSVNEFAKHRIAFVVPIFTAAAYNDAFYIFYTKYAKTPSTANVSHDLNLLSSKVNEHKDPLTTFLDSSSDAMRFLKKHTSLLLPNATIDLITDMDADQGAMFENGSNKYDVLILGHQEYVTQQEYDNFKHFVMNGGTLILLDANVFYAEVGYDPLSHIVTLIQGHGWKYNGRTAWKSTSERWANETSEWVGSNYLCYSCKVTFVNNPFEYEHHEEQYIKNTNAKVLLNYNASVLPQYAHLDNASLAHKHVIGAYELLYGKGKVVSLGIYADLIVDSKPFLVFFDRLLLSAVGRN